MDKNYIAELATRAVLYEVTTSPKPGLVDRFNNGAHHDMDFFTFMASSSAISKGFYEIAEFAEMFLGTPEQLFNEIRSIGIKMELNMFDATNDINTHKGIIFSLGVLTAATVKVNQYNEPNVEDIIDYVKQMTFGLTNELKAIDKNKLTNGEMTFNRYGSLGIRGEVEKGFPTVINFGLDALKNSYYTLDCKNDLFIQVIFSLMSACEDSTIISRHNPETLYEVQVIAKNFLESGGMLQENAYEILNELDQEFINRHISPGGSADLLAVTIFLGLIENIIK